MTEIAQLLPGGEDTIVATATAAGRSALAVIRISGPRSAAIVEAVTREKLGAPRVAALRTVYVPSLPGKAVDQSVITFFPGPASYTGEDLVELSTHGGSLVPSLVLEQLILAGARLALPGEFTRRAVLNGKIDLLQAEAIADLIDARSRGAATAALRQLDGGLTKRIMQLRTEILDLEALVAYDIDFPEEDDGPLNVEHVQNGCAKVRGELSGLLATAGVGELLREGALVVIAGLPNAGKSSLFNALVGSNRALVTEEAGTTRDAIEAIVDADPWMLRLVDTAGLRDATDVVERLGIEVAESYLSGAQVVLACGDSLVALETALKRVRGATTAPVIGALTKSDLVAHSDHSPAELVAQSYEYADNVAAVVAVSAVTGQGLGRLVEAIGAVLARAHSVDLLSMPLLVSARHERAIAEATLEMELFGHALETGELPMSIAATHLRAAVLALESLVGAVGVEEVLDRVFSRFCVGK